MNTINFILTLFFFLATVLGILAMLVLAINHPIILFPFVPTFTGFCTHFLGKSLKVTR